MEDADRAERQLPQRVPFVRRSLEEQSNVYKLVIIIYHAEKCKKSNAPCTAPEYCEGGRQLLEHAEECTAGTNCTEPNCLLSKKLVSHINACPAENCIFCQMVPPNIKEWYFSVTIRFRYTNILGMVRVISDMYPEFNEQRISRLNVFAKRTENRAFLTANSKDEYHRFLAVKLHEIVRSLHQCAPAA